MRYAFSLSHFLYIPRNVLGQTSLSLKVSELDLIRNWPRRLHAKWKQRFMVNVWPIYLIQRFEGDVRMDRTQLSILMLINVNSLFLLLKNVSRQPQLNLKWLMILNLHNINHQRIIGCPVSTGRLQEVNISHQQL